MKCGTAVSHCGSALVGGNYLFDDPLEVYCAAPVVSVVETILITHRAFKRRSFQMLSETAQEVNSHALRCNGRLGPARQIRSPPRTL